MSICSRKAGATRIRGFREAVFCSQGIISGASIYLKFGTGVLRWHMLLDLKSGHILTRYPARSSSYRRFNRLDRAKLCLAPSTYSMTSSARSTLAAARLMTVEPLTSDVSELSNFAAAKQGSDRFW
jgi:hypothetical protein